MDQDHLAKCPRCGSRRLIANTNRRLVPLKQDELHIPWSSLTRLPIGPLVEETTTTYSCVCSWNGALGELTA